MRILAIILLLVSTEHAGAEPVRVQRETLDGPDRIRAAITIEAPVPVLLAALETPCAVQAWLPGADELRVVNHENEHTEVRMLTRFPWPWRDRVARLVFKRRREGDRILITMNARPVESASGLVAVPYSRARWELHPENGRVHVSYQQRFTPGGTVPQWLADQVAENRVADALDNLESLVEDRRGLDDCDWLASAGNGRRGTSAGMP